MSVVSALDASSTRVPTEWAPSASPLPVVVRIAGLPATALAALGSPELLAGFARLEQIQREIQGSQRDLADLIASQLSRFSASERRFLLSVRRDSFNHRDLSRHLGSSDWRLIEELCPGFTQRQMILREESRATERFLEDLFEREVTRELDALYQESTDPRFLRGIALCSPDVVQALRENQARSANRQLPYSAQDRRLRKLDQTLLRFVTRAAAKLSPNSTLTTLALGRVKADPMNDPIHAQRSARPEETSSLRLDRIYLAQMQELLLVAPEIRALCRIKINDTLEQTDTASFRWIRTSRWQVEEENRKLALVPFSLVKAQLDIELLSFIRMSLAAGIDGHEDLYRVLSSQAGKQEDSALDRLVEIGLLQLLPPWTVSADSSEEAEILRLLQSREFKDPRIHELREGLARLVDLERRFSDSLAPDRCLLDLRLQVDALRNAAGRIPPIEGGLPFASLSKANRIFHENVFLLEASDSHEPEQVAALTVQQEAMEEICSTARTLYRFTELFNHRHDLLHSLEHFWRENFPKERALPLSELFRRIAPLWKQFVAFSRERRGNLLCTFNPYDLPEVKRLEEWRAQVYGSVDDCLILADGGYRLPPESLESLIRDLPCRYRPQVGPSGLVQPLHDPSGLWVLNRLLEGTGRYSNRYIAALPPETGRALASQFTSRARVELGGEVAELLDLTFLRGGASEVHHPQTPWLLELPGDCLEVSEDRKLGLGDIWVHFEQDRDGLAIRNGRGQRLLPVHLTSLNHNFLPSILRFLSTFGPYEVRQILPRSPQRAQSPGCLVSERVTCGRLVVSRKRWVLAQEAMSDLSAPAFYRAVQAWRERLGIPAEAYIYEQIHSPRENIYHYKPQYMNFASPLMAQLFHSMLKKTSDRYIIDEALPGRDQLVTVQDVQRAVEIQFECL